MKSNICQIQNNGDGRNTALTEAKKVAQYCELDNKQTMQLRLLTEELINMVQAIAFDCTANFRIEEENGLFTLYLTSNGILDRETRKQLVAASTSHKNEASKGIMGKIRAVFEYCLTTDSGEAIHIPVAVSPDMNIDIQNTKIMWALDKYRDDIADDRKKHRDEWDELEKSIIANLADNVTVSASKDYAEIIVTKRF